MTARAPLRCTVFQIHYAPEQQGALDPAFVPYDNAGKATELLEFDVFRRLAASPSVQSLTHWGAVSWRFGEKTGLTGREFLAYPRAMPQIDLWYLNPYPFIESLFPSCWVQGHTTHPRFLPLVEQVFLAAGLDPISVRRIEPSHFFSAANYFIGSQRFWALYLPFVGDFIERVESGLPVSWRQELHSSKADPKGFHKGSTYLPFVVERLLPEFLRTAGSDLAVQRVPLPREEAKLNAELRALRELKDRAVAERSTSLAGEWMSRRNRYVKPRTTPTWWAEFSEVLNPSEIVW